MICRKYDFRGRVEPLELNLISLIFFFLISFEQEYDVLNTMPGIGTQVELGRGEADL